MSFKKYYLYEEQVSHNGGLTWESTGNFTHSGTPLNEYSSLYDCVENIHPQPIPNPYEKQYFTIIPKNNGEIYFKKDGSGSYSYSTDSGTTWSTVYNSRLFSVTKDVPIMFKGNLQRTGSGDVGIGRFYSSSETSYISIDTQFELEGNIMSLIYGDDFIGQKSLSGKPHVFTNLFYYCTGLINIDNLVLPATTLAGGCYAYMFVSCKGLTKIPSGFLPATTMEYECYRAMFNNCISLVNVPYNLLPAVNLDYACYYDMFSSCTSLTTAPELPAISLVDSCYMAMFDGCTSLNNIKCYMQSIASYPDPLAQWVRGVSATGTFTKKAGVTWPTGDSGIPTGWTVVEV